MDKILWKEVRHDPKAWLHIKTVIAGAEDVCICTVCGDKVPLEKDGVERTSILRAVTRKHYYKHKRWGSVEFRIPPLMLFRLLRFWMLSKLRKGNEQGAKREAKTAAIPVG